MCVCVCVCVCLKGLTVLKFGGKKQFSFKNFVNHKISVIVMVEIILYSEIANVYKYLGTCTF